MCRGSIYARDSVDRTVLDLLVLGARDVVSGFETCVCVAQKPLVTGTAKHPSSNMRSGLE
jgi:hypothetical protein